VAIRASSEDEFARLLGALEKDAFEDEACAFLRRCFSDFQNVPAKPQGDGGLDGLSHGQTIAYCCYGPEQETSKVKAKGLKDDILKKYRGDLQTLLEVCHDGKGKLVHSETAELATIMGKGQRITTVRLIVSVFDTHQVIGPLNTSFDEYKAASQCRYVDKSANLTILGPKELATLGPVDDLAITRVEQRALLALVKTAVASSPPSPASTEDFDAKFDWLLDTGKVPKPATESLRQHFKKAWSTAIAVENELLNNAVTLHQALTEARQQAVVDANLAPVTEPKELMNYMRQRLAVRIGERMGGAQLVEVQSSLTDGELGRLIGECPVDWRK
jgi:hypothetical protein